MAKSISLNRLFFYGFCIGLVFVLGYGFNARNKMLPIKARAAMKNAHQIQEALVAYATSHDGSFPSKKPDGSPCVTANDAFRELFRSGLFDNEDVFYVQGSLWHPQDGDKKPDGDIGTAEDGYLQAVSKGENHWAYTAGVSHDRDASTIPLIMDGFTDVIGEWSADPKKRGGLWQGKYAITARLGGNAKVNTLDANLHVIDKIDGKDQNILDLIPRERRVKLLNPDG
jgi:hypothetical protein